MKRLALIFILCTLAQQGVAQKATVSGQVNLGLGSGAAPSFMRIQLVNCAGSVATAPDGTLVSFTPFDLPTNLGAWSTTLYGNDVLNCGGTAGGSAWRITPYFNNLSGPAATYVIQNGTTFVIDNASHCSSSLLSNCSLDSGVEPEPVASGVTSIVNSDGTLTFSPTTGAVVGSLNLGNANTWTALQTFPNIVDSALTPGPLPICANGPGGAFSQTGCTGGGGGGGGSGTVGTGTTGQLAVFSATPNTVIGSTHLDDGATAAGYITSTLPFLTPAGTAAAPEYSFSASRADGMYSLGTGQLAFADSGSPVALFQMSGISFPMAASLGWTGTAGSAAAALDTAFSRTGPATVAVGNGTPGNTTGTLLGNNIALAASLTTGGSSNVCGAASPCIGASEGVALPTPTAGDDFLHFNATNHCAQASYNGSPLECIPTINSASTPVANDLAAFNAALGGGAAWDLKDSGFSVPTAYGLHFPTAQPAAGAGFLNCTAANPAVCSWSAVGSGTPGGVNGDLQMFASGGIVASHFNDGGTNAGIITATEPVMLSGTSNTAPGIYYGNQGTAGSTSLRGYQPTATNNAFCITNAADVCDNEITNNGFVTNLNGVIGFSSSNSNAQTPSLAISNRATTTGYNVMAIGSGGNRNESATVRDGNTQRIIGATPYTNATTTPSTVVSWSTAQTFFNVAWSYECHFVYQSTATTASLVLSIAENTAPVNESAHARIFTTNTGTSTDAYVTGTASGNLPVLTGGAPAAANTNYEATIDGTVELNATLSGIFSIQAAASAAGTITIMRGSFCQLY